MYTAGNETLESLALSGYDSRTVQECLTLDAVVPKEIWYAMNKQEIKRGTSQFRITGVDTHADLNEQRR
jgi:hypothetical protein